ncbi:MAG: type IV pilus modification PilV family protein [Nitrospiraceae bacterium]
MNLVETQSQSVRACPHEYEKGFSLIEVMVSMVILSVALLGVMATFQWGDYGLQIGVKGTHAVALAESKLATKRTISWGMLLLEDLNSDGVPDVAMHDDGLEPDLRAGDGVFTASQEADGVAFIWTVQLVPNGPLQSAGSAVIQARARYGVGPGKTKEVRLGTVRANPRFVGTR